MNVVVDGWQLNCNAHALTAVWDRSWNWNAWESDAEDVRCLARCIKDVVAARYYEFKAVLLMRREVSALVESRQRMAAAIEPVGNGSIRFVAFREAAQEMMV